VSRGLSYSPDVGSTLKLRHILQTDHVFFCANSLTDSFA
jgi:hypothetical protein